MKMTKKIDSKVVTFTSQDNFSPKRRGFFEVFNGTAKEKDISIRNIVIEESQALARRGINRKNPEHHPYSSHNPPL
jgi:hypothetical protein